MILDSDKIAWGEKDLDARGYVYRTFRKLLGRMPTTKEAQVFMSAYRV